MQTYKIIITETAEYEINDCLDFIAKDSVQNAINWYDHLYEKIQTLETMPERCPIADENLYFEFEIHCLLINGYRVLYRIDMDTVVVIHVKSPNMNR